MMRSSVHVITGARGVGKTTLIELLRKWMIENGYKVTGILSPGIYDHDGQRTGILVKDAATGHEMRLADKGNVTSSEIHTNAYRFHPDAFRWGNELLKKAASGDLLVVDEIGPLELHLNQGWINAFDVIGSDEIACSIVVIRRELLPDAASLWPDARIWLVNRLADVERISGRMIKAIRTSIQDWRKRNRT